MHEIRHTLTREAHESGLELELIGHVVEYGQSGVLVPEMDIPRYAELHEEVRNYAIERRAIVIPPSYQFHEPRCTPGGPVAVGDVIWLVFGPEKKNGMESRD
jgi:hypothetical protein